MLALSCSNNVMADGSFSLTTLVQWLLIISFLIYGASCFLSEQNRLEFERYKLKRFRKITGALQLAACAGLLLGLTQPWLVPMAALGLTLMMFAALLVRLRLKDSIIATAPALFYFLISLFLFLSTLDALSPVFFK